MCHLSSNVHVLVTKFIAGFLKSHEKLTLYRQFWKCEFLIIFFFVACPPGFYGSYCNNTCPLGYYGDGCAGLCKPKCSDERCHRILGCVESNTVNFQSKTLGKISSNIFML